jgi:hypothetical protein
MYRKRSCRLLLRTFFDWARKRIIRCLFRLVTERRPARHWVALKSTARPPLSRIRSGFQFTEFTKAWKRVSAPFENLWLEHQMVLVGFGFTDVALGQRRLQTTCGRIINDSPLRVRSALLNSMPLHPGMRIPLFSSVSWASCELAASSVNRKDAVLYLMMW